MRAPLLMQCMTFHQFIIRPKIIDRDVGVTDNANWVIFVHFASGLLQ